MVSQRNIFIALVALLPLTLQADDVLLNLRGGIGTTRKDGVKDVLSFGVGYSYEISKRSAVVGELSYLYQPGLRELKPADGVAYSSDSVNFQKLTTMGLGIRGIYRRAYSEAWSWQAGAFLGGIKSRMDAVGDFRDQDGAMAGAWAAYPEKTGITLAPFGGLVYSMGETGLVEFNISFLPYKQVTLTPARSSGADPGGRVISIIADKSVTHVNFEVGISFRF